jgi:hypothetical protein
MTNDMQSLLEKITDLNNMVLQGKPMEAFETWYHDDVVMQENDQQPTIGKAANRTREEQFFCLGYRIQKRYTAAHSCRKQRNHRGMAIRLHP